MAHVDPFTQRVELGRREEVDFVDDEEFLLGRADAGEGILDDLYLRREARVGAVDDMEDEVALARVLQCRRKSLDQLGWQIANESNRIREEYFMTASILTREPHFADVCPERREEFVFARYTLVGEGVKETGFAGIRIADDANSGEIATLACLAMFAAGGAVFLEAGLDGTFFFSEVTFHDFGIRLADTARADTTTLTRELHAHAIDTRSHVADRRELDLELGFWCVCVECENFQDQINLVPDL